MKRILLSKKFLVGVLVSALVLTAVVGYISHVALKRLTFAGEHDELRVLLTKRGREVRAKLIERLDAEPVSFTSSDNITLKGLYIKRDRPVGTMILCHGYRSAKERSHRMVDMFDQFNILMFDFRGHGESGGEVVSIGCEEYSDVAAAANYAKSRMPDTKKHPLVILGISMGGAAGMKALSLDESLCDALIVDSSYADLWEVVNEVFTQHSGLPQFPFLPIMENMFMQVTSCALREMRPVDFARSVNKPVLFIHSCQDLHTKPDDTLRLYEATKSKGTKLWIGPACEHGRLHKHHAEDYKRKVLTFLRKANLIS